MPPKRTKKSKKRKRTKKPKTTKTQKKNKESTRTNIKRPLNEIMLYLTKYRETFHSKIA